MKKGGNDLTVGRPRKVILKFSIPILLSALLQQFYSMVDTIVVGQFLGTDALAFVWVFVLVLHCRWRSISAQKIIRRCANLFITVSGLQQALV